ncbi:MAG: DNA replication/repair protein RecF [Bacteroidota bacterium]|jgi:DNA replication and repair protein RecF
MLRIEQLQLTQFKNHPDQPLVFGSRVIGITGANGVGKTNLLDALYTLCFSRGYFSRSDQSLVRHGENGFRIDGKIQRNGQHHEVSIILRETAKKEIWHDGDLLPRLSDHLGRFPVVMIAPDDSELITGESKTRRQFLDALISQVDGYYLSTLTKFNRLLQQRQALLRECGELGTTPDRSALLDVIDEQWIETIRLIIPARKLWSIRLQQRMLELYTSFAGDTEPIGMSYQCDLPEESTLNFIRENRSRDIAAQRNTRGPHRDDLLFSMGGHSFKQVASQGQRKTLLFALKLAERSLLEEYLTLPPIVLLDDVFEKLDPKRISALLQWVAKNTGSQVFITDTDPNRLRENLDPLDPEWQLLEF